MSSYSPSGMDDSGPSSQRGTPTGSGPAPGKAGRLARSRAACLDCHKVKQRCTPSAEGTTCPCHRCVTWGIECVFPSSAGPAASRSTLGSNRASPAPSGKGKAPAKATTATTGQNNQELAEQLRVMTERLESIESTLVRAQITFPSATSPNHASGSDISTLPQQSNANESRIGSGNPVETAGEAMAVEGLVDLSAPGGRGMGGDAWDSMARPDVLDRGVMTLGECEAEFDLYFRHIHPWTAFLSTTADRNPLVVRLRSPLLFHSILLLTTYYRNPFNTVLYRAISSLLDSILCPQILCPQPDQLTPDFVRALHLLLLYKPVQYAALSARGVGDPAAVEAASKINVRSSWMLRGLISRVSSFSNLLAAPSIFARAFADQHIAPIPEEVINNLRLLFGCIFHESHGALQSGKPSNFLPQEALRTTRLFAKLRRQPFDVRLAASVELAATAATILNSRKENDAVEPEHLWRFQEELDAWRDYWTPILFDEREDDLAFTTMYPYAAFVVVVINGFAFTKWKDDKKAFAQANPLAPVAPSVLSQAVRDSIALAATSAQQILLAVTIEGKSLKAYGAGWDIGWPEDRGGMPVLTLDQAAIQRLRWASDSLTSVVYLYALIFLSKLANEGLLRSDLRLIAPGSSPLPLPPLDPNDKLCRLLQLGADLLQAIAPNPHHPAIKQAAYLRCVRDAGINGRRSVISAPGSPGPLPTHGSGMSALSSGSRDPQVPTYHFANSFEPPMELPLTEDPFGVLLSGASPSLFDGSQPLFSMLDVGTLGGEMGLDWEGMEREMRGPYEF